MVLNTFILFGIGANGNVTDKIDVYDIKDNQMRINVYPFSVPIWNAGSADYGQCVCV
jgi:hypothetical protein